MSVIARALRLSWRDRIDAARALWWLVAVHAGLRLLPFRRVRSFVSTVRRRTGRPMSVQACGQAVARASVLFPPARCLSRALAAECLLRRAGRDAQLRFAAGFDQSHALQAHAWLESGGAVVTGIGAPAELKPLN
jgi:hypothetical protein